MSYTCRVCDKPLDTVTGHGIPTEGDISICLYCGNIAIFCKDFTLRKPTESEKQEIENTPDVKKFLEVRRHIVSRHRH